MGSESFPRIEAARRALAAARVQGWHAADTAARLANEREREFVRVRDSRVRHALVRARRVVSLPFFAVAHPVQAIRRSGSWIGARFAFSVLGPMLEHARFTTSPLAGILPTRQDTDRVEPDQAIRWLGPVRINGVVRRVLFAHPNATISWRVPVTPGLIVVANCAIEPTAGPHNPHGLDFALQVRQVDGTWSRSVGRRLHPRLKSLDRRWRRLAIPVPAHVTGELEIQLKTTLPAPEVPDFAWAFWGEPRLLRRRPFSELARLSRANLQQQGLRGALRRLRHLDVTDGRTSYASWIARHARSPRDLEALGRDVATLPLQPRVSIITPVYNTDVVWLRACIESVRQQVYPHWELCLADDCSTSAETIRVLDEYATLDARIKLIRLATNSHISAASNAALDAATGDFIALLDHDDELPPEALAEIARAVNQRPDVDFLYTDEDKKDLAGARIEPYFKPDWSPEHFLNFMYTNHLMVLRRSLVDEVGRFRLGFEGAQDFDLALRVIAKTDRIAHVPHVLYHWRQIPGSAAADAVAKPWALANAKRALESYVAATDMKATVEAGAAAGLFRVRRTLSRTPLITLVITTDDRTREVNGRPLALLPNLVRSIQEKTSYSNYELLIIDNGVLSAATAAVLATVPHRRVSYEIEGRFNFAHKLNFSVRHAQGEQLVILNDDVEVITPDWLESMLEYAQDPAIGAVGAKLFYPDGRLQHAGVVMGVCGIAAHVFHQADGATPGYFGSTLGPRNYSALTAACLMTRRAVFDEVGGFNERLAIDFNDTDYCLRLRKAGYRIVFTPYAELYHHESGSHGVRTWNPGEANYMRANWPEVIAEDPYYNRNLNKDFPDYRL